MGSINLGDVFVGLAHRWPDRPAVASENIALSYRELVARAARTAKELRDRGVQAGRNVGVATADGGDGVTAMVALWMLGATPVPIDFRTTRKEREAFATNFDLNFMLEHRILGGPNYQSICVDESWDEIVTRRDPSPLFPSEPAPIALISLTSGTTGRPLGIILEHGALLFQLWLKDTIVTRGGRLLNSFSLHHSGARNQTLAHLLNGGAVHFNAPMFSTEEFAGAVAEIDATDVYSVSSIVRDLIRLGSGRASPLFENVRMMFCGGAPMSAEEKQLARKTVCANFVEGYSSSMVGGMTLLRGQDIDLRPESVGRVLAPVVLQIVDENDVALPFGENGTIRVRSPGMGRTTDGGATRSGGDRVKDGWVYPGDVGSLDRDGFLTLLGRTSEIIIRNGVNVHPSEVEMVLRAMAGVRDAAVTGYAAEREGEEVAAFVVVDGNISEKDLVGYCRASLAPDKRPRKFFLMKELPRNASGKVLKSALARLIENSAHATPKPNRSI